MKAILREPEIGVRCEGEMTLKRENTGNTLEQIRVCVVCVCVCVFVHSLQAQHPVPAGSMDLTLSYRSEIHS